MPLRHGLCGVSPFGSIAGVRPFDCAQGPHPSNALSCAPPIPRRSPGKIHPWIFPGLQNRYAILHVAKSPSMARYCLARKKNSFPALVAQHQAACRREKYICNRSKAGFYKKHVIAVLDTAIYPPQRSSL